MIVILPLILSGTRGFILSGILTTFFYYSYLKNREINLKRVFIQLFLVIIGYQKIIKLIIGGIAKLESNQARIDQIKNVLEQITILNSIIGFGIGKEINGRLYYEIEWLEIFLNQGVVGLFLWGYIFIFIIKELLIIKNSISNGLILGLVYLLILSFTNPFFTNIFGATYIAICLSYIKNYKKSGSADKE